ncbi:DUF4097 family beta strand repeat-containing protein [Glycomyces luteolus]|uniref:DUF4097 family beta strand repeat-containing protein n=1 Tax=Glycomyces luteolus TaxID=2670330 RepID=A0A9X3PBU3_9ACTN|nr:DUF4097 family beta strand repeat-containing protein [Glycomyces luteolus]MDA1361216.1 DUF4097 family beta strand repeat-containing protein [Glycomyces luteolus]
MHTFNTPAPITAAVDIILGDIRFTAADRTDTAVQVEPIDPTRELDIEAADKVNVEFEAGKLRVWHPKLRTAFTRKFGSVRITVALPAGSDVQGDTADGEYVVRGRIGSCNLKNAIGDIKVADTAEVKLKTTGGRVHVEQVRGNAEVSGSGDIRLHRIGGDAAVKNIGGNTWIGEAEGDLRVNAANGPITIDTARAAVEAKTSIGDITIGMIGTGPVELTTAIGRLQVGVPQDTAVELDARSATGRVIDHVAVPGTPKATVKVRVRTSGGDITVKEAQAS